MLGYGENPPDAKFTLRDRRGSTAGPSSRRSSATGAVTDRRALDRLRDRWAELLDVVRVTTPNEHVDRMVNV